MRRVSAVVIGLVLQTLVLAIEPKTIDEYAERSRAERPIALAEAKLDLKRISRWRAEDREEPEKELLKRIAALENPLEPYYALGIFNWSDLKVGDIGRIDSWKSLRERAGEEFDRVLGYRQYPQLKVFQVVGEDGALLKRSAGEVRTGIIGKEVVNEALFMARGMSTEGWVDGRDVVLDGVFAVTGTEAYATDAGSRTVPLLERLDLTNQADKFNRKSESRTWTTKNGKTTDAMYVRHDRGKVTLMNSAGKTTEIELTKLSDEDRKYVRKKIAESAQRKQAAAK
jgi:hypothetical protein